MGGVAWGLRWDGWRLPVQVNEVVWECGPLPHSLYSVWSFALAWGGFFFFSTPRLVRLSWPAAVRGRGCARTHLRVPRPPLEASPSSTLIAGVCVF